ncbi:9794_t:CDS:2, partial [Ambispora gerdemannii]
TPKLMSNFAVPTVEFLFDIQSPWAYIASTRISVIVRRTRAKVLWTPVSLGGVYEAVKAPQSKAGNSTYVMGPQRATYHQLDFKRTLRRNNLKINYQPNHPVKSLDALRLLHATPDTHREQLAHALYHSYWIQNNDISDRRLLLATAKELNIPSEYPLDNSIFTNTTIQERLRKATQRAVNLGAPDVPSFVINNYQNSGTERLFWGQDRLHFVELALEQASRGVSSFKEIDNIDKYYPRCVKRGTKSDKERTLRFWFDFASPWSFLAYTQLERIRREAGDKVKIEYMPFLLGAVFRKLGMADIPLFTMPKANQQYWTFDLLDWTDFWNALALQSDPNYKPFSFKWTQVFPIRSITALRVFLLEPKTIDCLFKASWQDDIPLGTSEEILANVLNKGGFDGPALIQATKNNVNNVKDRLLKNTELAVEKGLFGAPIFQVDDGQLVWGQDRINVVEDLLAGWEDVDQSDNEVSAKL